MLSSLCFPSLETRKDVHSPHLLDAVLKGIQSRKEEIKPPQSADDMILPALKIEMYIYRKIPGTIVNSAGSQDLRSTHKNQLHFSILRNI